MCLIMSNLCRRSRKIENTICFSKEGALSNIGELLKRSPRVDVREIFARRSTKSKIRQQEMTNTFEKKYRLKS